MIKLKKHRRTLNVIGKEKFDFDYSREKYIYSCLCRVLVKKWNVEDNPKYGFNSYKEWELYIREKYSQYDKEKLNEFSRYLNLRLRNIRPDRDIMKLFIPVMLTLFVDGAYDAIEDVMALDVPDTQSIAWVMAMFIVSLLVVAFIVFMLWQIISPIMNSDLEKNMFTDYKEIIDRMITEIEDVKKEDRL